MEYVGYKKLQAWEVADKLAHCIYDITISFPKEEIYSLTSQIRRAALSVSANIVEGHARHNKNEFRHFLAIALGSLAEVEYFIEFAYKRSYLDKEHFTSVSLLHQQCGRLLWKLYVSQSGNK